MQARDAHVPGTFRATLLAVIIAAPLALSASVVAPSIVPAGAADPTPEANAWQPVDVPPDTAPVRLEASGDGPNGLPLEPTLTFSRTDGGSADELFAGLAADPATTFAREDPADPAILVVRPAEPLRHATEYRITVRAADRALLGSWVLLTQAPPRVVSSVPGTWSDDVPVTTGIELTFDQPGVGDIAPYFSIDPPTPGRFETHDRTVAFVPDRPLLPDTEYEVRLAAGVPVTITGERMEHAWTMGFTTASQPGKVARRIGAFTRSVTEAGTGDAPLLPFNLSRTRLQTVPVRVHRLPDLPAAIAAVRAAQSLGERWDARLAVDTSGLQQLMSFDAELRRTSPWDSSARAITLPEPLPSGWYVVSVTDPAGDAQLVLQVSDLAVYSHVSTTRSVVWVNDLATGDPVRSANVRLVGGDRLGSTGADGLLIADTPEALAAAAPRPLLVVRDDDRAVLVPFGTGGWGSGDVIRDPDASDDWGSRSRYWSLLYTDRQQYRTTDAVNLWGLVRERDTDAVPAGLTLDLRTSEDDGWSSPIMNVPLTTSSLGGFVATLPLEDVPTGGYRATLHVDGVAVQDAWFEVAVIAKPAYRLTVEPVHRVFIEGETIPLTVDATFFDGTAVPGVPLVIEGSGAWMRTSTDLHGQATARIAAETDRYDDSQWSTVSITARPGRGEEGGGAATTSTLVFRSAVVLTADATISGGQAVLRGGVDRVDRKRLEREYDRAFEIAFDPRGAPVAGATIGVRVVEETPTRTQDGTRYDFVAKKVVPVWSHDTRQETIRTTTLTSDATGRYELTFPVTRGHGYRVELATSDAQGRTTGLEVWAQRQEGGMMDAGAYLAAVGARSDASYPVGVGSYASYPHVRAAIGDRVAIEMRGGDQRMPVGGENRYLWLTSQRGLRSATIASRPVHAFTFRAVDAPMLEVSAVRFTGETYIAAPDSFAADFDPAARDLRVTIDPAQARYAPGESATVDVLVQDPRGRPVVADVALRAIDEKLYAIGAAAEYDPLSDLYRSVDTGTRWTYASHQVPKFEFRGEGGDAGGGESPARMDFRDQVLFTLARTGEDGHALVTFDLSDDLTSWRVTGTAMTARLQVGEGSAMVPVGLPFFVDVVLAPEYLVDDEVAVRVRAYGRGLAEGDEVRLEVSAPSLGMEPVAVTTPAFTEVIVPLPPLTAGSHAITVSGAATGTEPSLQDRLVRTISVVPSRLTEIRTAVGPLDAPATPAGGAGINSFVVTDAGRGASLGLLLELTAETGLRADQVIAAAEARRLLVDRFGMDASSLPAATLDRSQFQTPDGGIALLPYAKADLGLSALVAITAPDSVDRDRLSEWLGWRLSDLTGSPGSNAEAAIALAGLAALGEPVMDRVQRRVAAGPTGVDELAWLAVAAAEAGDLATARTLAREVLERRGQQQGPYVRLTGRGGAPDARLTGLMAMVAARLGQIELVDAADRYLRLELPADAVAPLERLGASMRRMDVVPAAAGRLAVTVEGERREVALEPGATWSVVLVPGQLDGLLLEPLEGSLTLASSWLEPMDPGALVDDAAITVTRRVTPAGPVASDAIVAVRLRVGLTDEALDGCYLVTDLAPSGLAPVADDRAWRDREGQLPWRIDGQRVTFCVWPDPEEPIQVLRYTARVVTPGTYAWEPTLVQSMEVPEVRELGRPGSIVLR